MTLTILAATQRDARKGDWTYLGTYDEHTILDGVEKEWPVMQRFGLSMYKIVDVDGDRDWHGPVSTGF